MNTTQTILLLVALTSTTMMMMMTQPCIANILEHFLGRCFICSAFVRTWALSTSKGDAFDCVCRVLCVHAGRTTGQKHKELSWIYRLVHCACPMDFRTFVAHYSCAAIAIIYIIIQLFLLLAGLMKTYGGWCMVVEHRNKELLHQSLAHWHDGLIIWTQNEHVAMCRPNERVRWNAAGHSRVATHACHCIYVYNYHHRK